MTLRRTPLQRGPWRKRKDRIARPGETEKPRTGAKWRALCAVVRDRDRHGCRRCGTGCAWVPRDGGGLALTDTWHVDHILPRRLCPSPEAADVQENLVLLCGDCHAVKTMQIEPALYAGNLQPLHEFLRTIGDPWPSNALRTYALAQATAHLEAIGPPRARRFVTTLVLQTPARIDLPPFEGWKVGDLVRVTVERL